jgi:hypothetical protein
MAAAKGVAVGLIRDEPKHAREGQNVLAATLQLKV